MKSPKELIRISIADDHPVVLNGIKDMLLQYPHIRLEQTYADGESLLEGLKHNCPDVLLLDIQMPGKSGDELVPVLTKTYPRLRILILSNFNQMIYIHNMLSNGAAGYLSKNTDEKAIVEAIETVYRGGEYLKPDVRQKLDEFRKQIRWKTSTKYGLTPREKDILRLMLKEYSNPEIAEELCISLRTVENYRFNLATKLEVKNTIGLVKKVIELGLLD
jgi:DNA-binding NarL/FixJ family response regulator